MSRMIGPRAFPDGSASEPRKPRRRSPSDIRREARRLVERQAEARADRRDGWPDGKDEFAVERQEEKLSKLDGEKRALRRDVYRHRPESDPGSGPYVHTSEAGKGK